MEVWQCTSSLQTFFLFVESCQWEIKKNVLLFDEPLDDMFC